jgi:hypothetical protein
MKEIFAALNINANYKTSRTDKLSSRYSVSELASASLGAVGVSISVLIEKLGLLNYKPMVQVDNRLASLWFGQSIKPINWNMPPLWDSIAGDYRCSDGWIKLHTNSPHHRQAWQPEPLPALAQMYCGLIHPIGVRQISYLILLWVKSAASWICAMITTGLFLKSYFKKQMCWFMDTARKRLICLVIVKKIERLLLHN